MVALSALAVRETARPLSEANGGVRPDKYSVVDYEEYEEYEDCEEYQRLEPQPSRNEKAKNPTQPSHAGVGHRAKRT